MMHLMDCKRISEHGATSICSSAACTACYRSRAGFRTAVALKLTGATLESPSDPRKMYAVLRTVGFACLELDHMSRVQIVMQSVAGSAEST